MNAKLILSLALAATALAGIVIAANALVTMNALVS